eukprot:g7461.t1
MGDAGGGAAPPEATTPAPAARGLDSAEIWGEDDIVTEELKRANADEINQRIRLLENDIRVMKSEQQMLTHEMKTIEAQLTTRVLLSSDGAFGTRKVATPV